GQVPVHQGHRHLGVVVGTAAQTLDDGDGADVAAEVHQQTGRGGDAHAGHPGERRARQLDAHVDGQQRCLAGVLGDGDHDVVEQRTGAPHDVEVAERDRVEGPGADGGGHVDTVPAAPSPVAAAAAAPVGSGGAT